MILTKDMMKNAINEGCELCYEQCRILGIIYPASHSWKKKFTQLELSEDAYTKFMELKAKTKPYFSKKEFKEKVAYKPHVEPVCSGDNVIVTDEWLKSGMINGNIMRPAQAKLLGLNVKEKGWKKNFIGSEIPKDIAEQYIKLKYAVGKATTKKGKKQNTKDFIENYLTSEGEINRKSVEGKLLSLKYVARQYDKDKVVKHIKRMPYKEFLKTPYWKIIADFQKFDTGYSCVICGSKDVLNVHHTTYKNHGNEIENLTDLITVCRECHKKIHNIK